MIDITGLREDKRPQSSTIVHALLDRLEAAEKEREIDEQRIADLMAELNRVGHENDALRAKIAEMERQEPVAKVESWTNGSYTRHYKLKWLRDVNEGAKLYALPGAQPAPSTPSEEAAAEMGANGGHVVEAERLAFEAWMRGHCWKLGAKWTGTEYRSDFEKGGMVDMHAMRTRELWAAWRDRAALAAPKPEAKP